MNLDELDYITVERARDYIYQDELQEMANTSAKEDWVQLGYHIMKECLCMTREDIDLAIYNLDMTWDDFK